MKTKLETFDVQTLSAGNQHSRSVPDRPKEYLIEMCAGQKSISVKFVVRQLISTLVVHFKQLRSVLIPTESISFRSFEDIEVPFFTLAILAPLLSPCNSCPLFREYLPHAWSHPCACRGAGCRERGRDPSQPGGFNDSNFWDHDPRRVVLSAYFTTQPCGGDLI